MRNYTTNEQGSRVGRLWCWVGWHHWVSWTHAQVFNGEPIVGTIGSVTWYCTRRGCHANGGYDY
ncbi:hypothetical protein LCGC14_2548610 [marine sediment metagenome]|uniref:Uncharacterized protein n=1 Tax=marine sediment metagenome TaxID=412755 RepID=A0A0F9CZV1_9ZZZZ